MKAIAVEGLWKQYRYGSTGYLTLRHDLESWWARARGKEDPNAAVGAAGLVARGPQGTDTFWALKEVSFAVEAGEVVGIIGRNGAGKSTLLKILSRVTAPTRGVVRLRGRVASLLEVGTGFHPELTGRENVYLNGAILGMSRAEIRRKFDEIVAFAELERFIDTPVKRYSSGMEVRLAFAVAAHLEPEILLVDEVLAVGDAGFQQKCLGKIGAVGREGRTVLFVSHNLGMVAKLCERVIVLEQGALACDDAAEPALRVYHAIAVQRNRGAQAFTGPLCRRVGIRGVRINGEEATLAGVQVRPADGIEVRIAAVASESVARFRMAATVHRDGCMLLARLDAVRPCDLPAGEFSARMRVPPWFLSPGEYTLKVTAFSAADGEWLESVEEYPFVVTPQWRDDYDPSERMGLVHLPQDGCRVPGPPIGEQAQGPESERRETGG